MPLAKPASEPFIGRISELEATVSHYAEVIGKERAERKRLEGLLANPASEPAGGGARAWSDVLAERSRQVEAEGWTPDHDDEHDLGQMPQAAAVYAAGAAAQAVGSGPEGALYGLTWPWEQSWLKWGDARRNLVKAGALILAEIERLDRASGTALSSPASSCTICNGTGVTDQSFGMGTSPGECPSCTRAGGQS